MNIALTRRVEPALVVKDLVGHGIDTVEASRLVESASAREL